MNLMPIFDNKPNNDADKEQWLLSAIQQLSIRIRGPGMSY